MSSLPLAPPGSPVNTSTRTCIPQADATDEVRLNCILLNYLQQIIRPLPGQNSGFFSKQSPVPILLHSGNAKNRSHLELSYGPFQVPYETVAFTITAQKLDYYHLTAKAVALDGISGNVVAQKELKIRINVRKGPESRWDNADFIEVLSLLRWKCKVYYDSYGRHRPMVECAWIRGRAPWDEDVDI
jgi:hypothetical protein